MFLKDMVVEEQKFNEVRDFLDNEITRLSKLVEEYKKEIRAQGEKFNMDNPYGGLYSGVELTDLHYEMEKRFLYSQEATNDIEFYKKLRNSPYFARVDFKMDGTLNERKIYIGLKTLQDPENFEMLVCDWRAPIASLFYEDFEDKAFFDAPKGRIYGDLLLKRQYKFKDGRIDYYVDSDIKIDDDILREVLSTTSGEHLKVIVNSIQREQNKAVRYSDKENLLVLGPAGSGKTSVGFHRLAFLLYQNRNELSSAEIVMFSNNDIFSSYVADIISELGEMPINSASFYSVFAEEIPTVNVLDYYSLAEEIMNGNTERERTATIKMGKEFMDFLVSKGNAVKPDFKDIVYKNDVIISKEELLNRFNSDDGEGTAKAKGERLCAFAQNIVEEYFRENKERIYHEIDAQTAIDEDTSKLLKIEKIKIKTFSVDMINEATLFDPVATYFRLLSDFAKKKNDKALLDTEQSLQKGELEFEDALGVIYLKTILGTAANLPGVKHVLIDEAQDFSLIQHEILKRSFPKARFTLLADTNQAIISGLNTVNEEILAQLYGAKVMKLDKSYRSTEEINSFAIKLLPESERYEIFKRNGEPVEKTKGSLTELVALINKERQERKTFAIITKTAEQARSLHKQIIKTVPGICLCDNKSCEISDVPVIIPLALTKGLEFDCVIVADKNGCFTTVGNERYLYLASTRALHKLNIFNLIV